MITTGIAAAAYATQPGSRGDRQIWTATTATTVSAVTTSTILASGDTEAMFPCRYGQVSTMPSSSP